uniref:Uncharacterized protein n=1 Tax=Vitrella brassicaformis TaxID=1169539 RepID=A0A7S1K795_9ALVE
MGGGLAAIYRCGIQEPNTPPQRPPTLYFVLCVDPFIVVTSTDILPADDGFDAEVRIAGEAESRCHVRSLADLNRVLDHRQSEKYAAFVRRLRGLADFPGVTFTATTAHKFLNMDLQ